MQGATPRRSMAAEFAISILWLLGAFPIALALWYFS
jgi:hypothetical protein